MNPELLAGQLLVVGYAHEEPSARLREQIRVGQRAGVVLFKRNIPEDLRHLALLTRAFSSADNAFPALVAVDQEGGRVVRMRSPALPVPAVAKLGAKGEAFLEKAAYAQSLELRALGFSMNFAPVLDVHTEPKNPIIGDRAFGTTPEQVVARAGAWARGMKRAGLLSCGKHFPGHGDTTVDSHLALPRVSHDQNRLHSTEMFPFLKLASAVDSLMSAHVVYDVLDADVPATLSHAICTKLLRDKLGFQGVLFSDDLEMKALSGKVEDNAVAAVNAGCDMLLICSDESWAERAHEALTREIEKSEAFRARAMDAVWRSLRMRRRCVPAPDRARFSALVAEHAELALELA